MKDSKQTLNWTDQVIDIWISQGIELKNGLSIDKISNFEKLLNFEFPKDFTELYLKVNGFENSDWNENMFSLWSLDRIFKEYQEECDTNYIGFCDYLINSHTIGFFKTDKGVFKNYNQIQPIANTFKEGIELIISNSDLIY